MKDIPLKIYECAELYKCVAHPIRLMILKLIAESDGKERMVKSIYRELELDQPTVSHHLSILRKRNVIERDQRGNDTYYSIQTHSDCIVSIVNKIVSIES